MHDIWNPWHGCVKCSEGCQNCYMYYLDALRGKSGAEIYRTGAGFRYPLSKTRDGRWKVQSGEMLRVCMTSDFFLEEADAWRPEAWDIIRQRPDVQFFLLTKRPQRVAPGQPFAFQRFRQRFMHKLCYYPMNQDGLYSCVGCGRCVLKCPIHMNIVKVIKALGGKQDEH